MNVCSRKVRFVLACSVFLFPCQPADGQVPVHHIEGLVHGFLVLRTLDGETLAHGDLIQVAHADRVTAHLIFHFKDGSLHDETAVYSQLRSFRLLRYHLVQKGPSFSSPKDVSIDVLSGQITVRNRQRIITRLQAYEYVVANGGLRTAQSLFGMVLVAPGPIGLYRRKALQDVVEKDIRIANRSPSGAGKVSGPFSHETFAEDFQLSLTILALGGRIVYEPSAVSYTKSPDLTHTLLSQRYRWYRGTLQVLRIYLRRLRHVPGSRKRRLNVIIAGVYLLDLFVLPVLNVIILFGATIVAATSATLGDLMMWVAAIWLLNLLSATYHMLTQRDDLSLLSLVPFYDLYHGVLLNSAWAIAMFDELRQSKMNW